MQKNPYEIWYTIYSPKYDLAETKSLNDLINRITVLKKIFEKYRKMGRGKVRYTNMDHVHQFTTTDKAVAKELGFAKMSPEE